MQTLIGCGVQLESPISMSLAPEAVDASHLIEVEPLTLAKPRIQSTKMLDADMNLAESTVEREEEERNTNQCSRFMKNCRSSELFCLVHGYLTCWID